MKTSFALPVNAYTIRFLNDAIKCSRKKSLFYLIEKDWTLK